MWVEQVQGKINTQLGPFFFLPLNYTAHKPFKQLKKLFFPNDYFHVKFTEVKTVRFQQAAVLFWRTAGTFYAGNRLKVLFPRRKDRYFWKVFWMFSLGSFSVLPVKARKTWTCRIQGWFCKLDTFFYPTSPPDSVKRANFNSVPENALNTDHHHPPRCCLLKISYTSRIKLYLPWRPCLIIQQHCVRLPEFPYLYSSLFVT